MNDLFSGENGRELADPADNGENVRGLAGPAMSDEHSPEEHPAYNGASGAQSEDGARRMDAKGGAVRTGVNGSGAIGNGAAGAEIANVTASAGVVEGGTGNADKSGSFDNPTGAIAPETADGREMTAEMRRKNAALRRERERARIQAEREAERRAAQIRIDRAYADAYAGKINPYTGRAIASEADYNAYRAAIDKETTRKKLEKSGLSVDVLNVALSDHPVVKQAEEAIRAAESVTQAARIQKTKEGLTAEMSRISALDPSVKSLDDLVSMPDAERFFDLVQNSKMRLSDAFKLLRFDELSSKKAKAALSAARRAAVSKEHLTSSASRGETAFIPGDTLALYKELFPNKSDAEFQRHYAAHNKK